MLKQKADVSIGRCRKELEEGSSDMRNEWSRDIETFIARN
jgi:hypothetical protein